MKQKLLKWNRRSIFDYGTRTIIRKIQHIATRVGKIWTVHILQVHRRYFRVAESTGNRTRDFRTAEGYRNDRNQFVHHGKDAAGRVDIIKELGAHKS